MEFLPRALSERALGDPLARRAPREPRPAPQRRLSGTQVAGGDVQQGFSVDPSGRAVYIADQDEDTVAEVYLASLTFPRAQACPAALRPAR
jgi:hypothetical protein